MSPVPKISSAVIFGSFYGKRTYPKGIF